MSRRSNPSPTPCSRRSSNSDTAAFEALFDPDIAVWHAGDQRDNDRRRALRVIAWFIDSSTQRRYEILDRQFFQTGFVQQHILHATGTNGTAFSLPARSSRVASPAASLLEPGQAQRRRYNDRGNRGMRSAA